MNVKQRSIKDDAIKDGESAAPDWMSWLRLVERKQRMVSRLSPTPRGWPREFLVSLTLASFRLEGMQIDDAQATESLGGSRRIFRSRLGQRLRNHVAILHAIQRLVSRQEALKIRTVLRWYTSISCGLCNSSLDEATMIRLDAAVRQISSPRLRLKPAVQEMARLQAQWMSDPLFPSFNGIMARLLLHYHLGRCGLPPVMFDSAGDGPVLADEARLLPKVMALIDTGYSMLLNGK